MYIDQKDIFEKTDGGRLIIEAYYPNSVESFKDTRKKFKAHDEKTPSASVKRGTDGIWIVTDFGADQKPRNAIQVVQHEENCDFKTALQLIATRFGIVAAEKQAEVFKPQIEKRDANPEEEDEKWYFETKEFSSQEVLTILAPKVWEYLIRLAPGDKNDKDYESKRFDACIEEVIRIFKKYHFHSLKSYTIVKNRKATVISSTDSYPIFMFDEKTDNKNWKKIYQPKNADASMRFMHYNGRPADFVFGYSQAKKAYDEVIKIADDSIDDEEEDDGKKDKKPKKLKQVIIVSGGSDALNIACIGQCFKSNKPEQLVEQMWPIWLNSETAKLQPGTFKNLQGIAEKVYNLPDIDKTGLRSAHEMAQEYLDLYTIYLPEELRDRRDTFRNKECKDVRDYFKFYTPWDFFKLFKTAYPYRFWDMAPRYNKKGEWLGWGYNVNNRHLYNFLQRNGFYRYATDSEKDQYIYIHIDGNIVRQVVAKDIRDYVNRFIEERNPEIELMNTFYRTTQLNETSLSNLPYITIDFTDFDKESQWMFFKNATFCITKDGIKEYKPGAVDKYVWEDEVINHRVKLLDAPFEIKKEIAAEPGVPSIYDIEIKNDADLYLRYLINCSRISWREELERRLEGIPEKDREDYALKFNLQKEEMAKMQGYAKEHWAAYREKYKFRIDGQLLTNREIREQKMNLINKIYAHGYAFHRYKNPSKAWAIWSMDAKLSDGDESHGGSGKSLPQTLIREHNLMNTKYLEGRNTKLTDNQHVFENVTEHTDLIIVDDCHRYIKFEFFFSAITGPLTVNPKNSRQYAVGFSVSPKLWFSSNYAPHNIDPSKERRILYTMYSDYYHHNKMGEYREDRAVSHDFGKNLGNDFTEEEWNLYLNTIMHCIRFYLSADEKINPPMDNVNKRNMKAIMGEAFEHWADVYFSEESGRLDKLEVKTDALNDFQRNTKQNSWTAAKFRSALEAWCYYNGYELDPQEFRGNSNRIIKKVKVQTETGEREMTKEMIYIRTKWVEATADGETPAAQASDNADDEMPF